MDRSTVEALRTSAYRGVGTFWCPGIHDVRHFPWMHPWLVVSPTREVYAVGSRRDAREVWAVVRSDSGQNRKE